jgi:hypothetical protein
MNYQNGICFVKPLACQRLDQRPLGVTVCPSGVLNCVHTATSQIGNSGLGAAFYDISISIKSILHQRRQCGQSTVFEFVYCPACDMPIIVTLCQEQTLV